jgi:hypothetical protein
VETNAPGTQAKADAPPSPLHRRSLTTRSVSLDLGKNTCVFALPRKEVIQPHLPVRLPCYDFTPITDPTLDACLPLPQEGVSPAASGVADFRGVTGGVYKTRERIHRDVLTHGY